MKRIMEKVSILALSFILTTSFSISSAQSAMFAYYKGIPHSMIELLVSLPSAGIMVSLIFNKWIGRLFSERQMIVIGLVAYALCGFIPLISPAYPVVFLSRIIFGMAVGLLNVSAIAIISERYKGKERVQTLGIRGSAEVVGTAVLTFGVSLLIRFGWQAAFLVYGISIPILLLYLLFVPYGSKTEAVEEKHRDVKMTGGQWRTALGLAVVAAAIVLSNVMITVRIPSVVEQVGHGTAQTAGIILATMQFVGILAGLAFSPLTQLFRDRLLVVSGVAYGLTQLLIGVSTNLWMLALVTIASGFAYSVALTTVYNVLSDKMPAGVLSQATSIAVLGCSTGSIATTFVLSLLGTISSAPVFIFGFSGILMILVSFFGLWIVRKSGK